MEMVIVLFFFKLAAVLVTFVNYVYKEEKIMIKVEVIIFWL